MYKDHPPFRPHLWGLPQAYNLPYWKGCHYTASAGYSLCWINCMIAKEHDTTDNRIVLQAYFAGLSVASHAADWKHCRFYPTVARHRLLLVSDF